MPEKIKLLSLHLSMASYRRNKNSNPLSESISFIDKTRLNNINTQIFNALKHMDIETTMFFFQHFNIHYL
jgi:hypothetical protein